VQGQTVTQPANPTRKGYTFAGWYTDATDGRKFNFATPILSNLFLYAHWTSANSTANSYESVIKPLPTKHSNYKKKFKDISKLNSSRKSAVQEMYKYGITEGANKAGDKYAPNNKVNRGAMAQFMYKLRGQAKTTKSVPKLADINAVTDDRAKAIKWLASEKITVTTNGKYNPNNIVNRGSMAEFLYKLAGSPAYTPTKADYAKIKDINKVKKNPDRQKAIAWLVKNKISVLDKKGKFNPTNTVNRGSMAEFMMKLYKMCVK
jgi:uncharacterized repeat protein (TIGR02543 family)